MVMQRTRFFARLALLLLLGTSGIALSGHQFDLAGTGPQWPAYLALGVFLTALLASISEEYTEVYKSMPVILAASIIWIIVALVHPAADSPAGAEAALRRSLLEYLELMLLLLVTMTYINALNERQLFIAIKGWVANMGYSYSALFWLTGLATFLLSPVLDNVSAALIMGTVVFTVGQGNPRFVALASINVVVAANAGGVFHPFGDISTLVMWQHHIQMPDGVLDFPSFFSLLVPAMLAYFLPAIIMHFSVPAGRVPHLHEPTGVRRGTRFILVLFLLTLATSVLFETVLQLPAAMGMMTGLGYLGLFGYYLKHTHQGTGFRHEEDLPSAPAVSTVSRPFDIFRRLARVEWDALFFLYGVAMSIGGLAYLGWMTLAGGELYGELGPGLSNVLLGLGSGFIENVPATYAVLAMQPEMSLGHWLLVTLTIGIGGSLLSIGSAAGIVLMGQSGGQYTFFKHLRWTPAIALGYAVAVLGHYWLNARLF